MMQDRIRREEGRNTGGSLAQQARLDDWRLQQRRGSRGRQVTVGHRGD